MVSNRKKSRIAPVLDENPEIMPVIQEMQPGTVDLFKKLSNEEQDEILKMIISEGGMKRILSLFEIQNSSGNIDLFFDRIRYYHFLPLVDENPNG